MDQLSKKAAIQIPLSKIAVEKDQSYAKLMQLLLAGYDRVSWVNTESNGSPCPLCAEIENQVNMNGSIDLANFLGFKKTYIYKLDENGNQVPELDEEGNPKFNLEKVVEIYKDAPLYNFSHVGCKCYVKVFKSNGEDSPIFVTRNG